MKKRLRAAALLGVAAAACLGAALRLAYLDRQVLAGDEFHLVPHVVTESLGTILRGFSPQDFNVPHAALTRLASEAGLGVSERLLRAPMIVFGGLTLLLLPAAAARLWGPRVGWTLLWLTAVSPLLVFYARIVRSYGWIAFLGPASVFALVLGWRFGGAGWWRLAGALGALAVWAHLLAAPFVAGAFLALGLAILVDHPRGARDRWRDYLNGAGMALALMLATLAPATAAIARLLHLRPGGAPFDPAAWATAGLHLAGSALGSVGAALATLAIVGLVRACRSHPLEGLLIVAPIAAQAASLVLLRPTASGIPLVLARYLVVALPLLLLAVAFGAEALVGRAEVNGAARVALAWAFAPILAVALLAVGPLPGWLRPSRFLHARDAVNFVAVRAVSGGLHERLQAWKVADRRVAFVSSSWTWTGLLDVVAAEPLLGDRLRLFLPATPDSRLALRNAPPFSVRAAIDSDAEFLVVHRAQDRPSRRRRSAIAAQAARYRELGLPFAREGGYEIWDLERLRRQSARRERWRTRR